MMILGKITCTRIKRYGSLMSVIGKFRSQLRFCIASDGPEQVPPCETLQLDYRTLQKKQSKMKLAWRKPRSDFKGCYSFVIDDAVADAVVKQVITSIEKDGKVSVIEINPGFGKITKQLIENGIEKVYVCELHKSLWTQELSPEYKQNIKFHYYHNKFDRCDKLDRIIPQYLLKKQDFTQIIIVINSSRMFLRNIFQTISFVDFGFLMEHKLFILVSDLIFGDSTHPTSEMVDYGFIDVVFDVKVLAEFPRTAVSPPPLEKFKNMYLVRLTRKSKPLISEENIIMYWNFVNVLSKMKNVPVLARLEKCIPGCGPLLISNGLPVFTKLRELSKSDVLAIFKILLSDESCRFAMNFLKEDNVAMQSI